MTGMLSVMKERLRKMDPTVLVNFQIISHAYLMLTGFASSVLFCVLLVNKSNLLISVSDQDLNEAKSQDPTNSPVLDNSSVLVSTLTLTFLHSTISIIASAIFLAANRFHINSDLMLSSCFQATVIIISSVITFATFVTGCVMSQRLGLSLDSEAVPDLLTSGMPVYLVMISIGIVLQGLNASLLLVGGFQFTQLIEENDDCVARVRLEIQPEASPAVNVQLPREEGKTLQQVMSKLTLPGRDRLASLRSLHAYDPVNTSPGLYAVPLTPFDASSGTWSNMEPPQASQKSGRSSLQVPQAQQAQKPPAKEPTAELQEDASKDDKVIEEDNEEFKMEHVENDESKEDLVENVKTEENVS